MTFKASIELLKIRAMAEIVPVLNDAILRSLLDGAITSDDIITAITKSLSDNANTSELVNFNAIKSLKDTALVTEIMENALNKVLQDQATVSDEQKFTLHAFRLLDDITNTSDQIVKSITSNFSDNANTSVSGYVYSEDYSEFYFAGDYVGTSYTL